MGAASIPFEQVLPALRARWHRVALTALAVVAVVLAVSIALPARYEATSTVVLEINGADPVNGQAVFKPAGAVSTYITTQADVLKSEVVALGVVRSLGLDRQPDWRARWTKATGGEGAFEPWIAGQLLRRLDVRPARDSNAVTVGFTSDDAAFSAAVANAFVRAYTDETLRMRADPARKFNVFFAERAKALREALSEAKGRLSAYEKEHGVLLGEESDVESARLAEMTSQLVTLQDAATEAANARKQASASPGATREVRNDPEVAALSAELVRQQGRLADLKSEFGEQHYAVIQARQSLADLRRRMEAAMRRAAGSLEAPLRVQQARVAEMQAAIERQRALVQRRKAQRDNAAPLLRDVDNAQRAYDAVLARASQTALESANTTQTSVSVIKAATPPLWSPAFLVRNGVAAALLGLLLGAASALRAEGRDRRLRTAADVTERLEQALLLVLPDARAHVGRNVLRADETRRRLVAGTPLLGAPREAGS